MQVENFRGSVVSSHAFRFLPFAACQLQAGLAVGGTLSRRDNVLHLLFRISGDLTGLVLPRPEGEPLRCDNLWQTTCFECFIRPRGKRSYHELNLSPNGCWNLYHFSEYRTAMREEPAVGTISSETFTVDADFVVRCVLPLGYVAQPAEGLDIGLSCVLEQRDGGKSYWALSHPGQQPDFHHPDGFGLRV